MAKYFYVDKETGRLKKYVGNVEERDGKLYGKLVTSKVNYSVSNLHQVSSHQVVDKEISYLVWKDKFGIEHELSDDDMVKGDEVIDKRQYTLDIIYHPAIEEKVYYIDKSGNEFTGKIKEIDGKYFGIL